MKRLLLSVVVPILSITISTQSATANDNERVVVLISVDGLAASYLKDPRANIPTIRKLAHDGASAEGMITSFPSVTWPSHVSLITGTPPGRHGVLANRVLDRKTGKMITFVGDPTFTKDECVRVPTLYDVVSQAGMKTASVIWPACNGAKTLDWVIPDSNQVRLHREYTTPGFAEELDRAGISIAKLGKWEWQKDYSAMRDATYTRVATYLLKQHRPNLLLLHLITPDHVEHAYGPHVEESYWSVANADDRIREIWEALNQPPLAGKATLFVVADHGFAAFDKYINPNVVLKNAGLVEVDKFDKVTKRRAWSLRGGGCSMIYLLDDENKETLRQQVKEMMSELEGVDKVLDVDEFTRYGLPDPAENPQQADLMLVAKRGYSFDRDHRGTNPIKDVGSRKGAHGHLPDPPYMHAMFVAAGAGIKPGIQLKTVSNLDVAPTIAKLLGVELPTAEGRVLTEILSAR